MVVRWKLMNFDGFNGLSVVNDVVGISRLNRLARVVLRL